jgi:hypothetical protein
VGVLLPCTGRCLPLRPFLLPVSENPVGVQIPDQKDRQEHMQDQPDQKGIDHGWLPLWGLFLKPTE